MEAADRVSAPPIELTTTAPPSAVAAEADAVAEVSKSKLDAETELKSTRLLGTAEPEKTTDDGWKREDGSMEVGVVYEDVSTRRPAEAGKDADGVFSGD